MENIKVKIFIEDGAITGTFATVPNIAIEIYNFDKNVGKQKVVDRLYAEANKTMKAVTPYIDYCCTSNDSMTDDKMFLFKSALTQLLNLEPTEAEITVCTENCDGLRYTKTATAAEWFVDWYGECEMCPANDAPIHGLILQGAGCKPVHLGEGECPEFFEDLMEAIRPTMVYHHWGDEDEDYIETSEPGNMEPRYFIGKENAIRFIQEADVPFAKAVECVGVCKECGNPVFPSRRNDGIAICPHCYSEYTENELTD